MDPVGVVTELARRFQAGDGAGALRLFHPDIRIEQPASLPHGGWHSGRDGVAAMGAIFSSLWDRAIGQPRILGCGETVVQVTTQTWTARASGRSATVDVVELFSFRDGLVWQIRVFQQDTHLLMNTLTGDAGMQSATNSSAAPGQPKPRSRSDTVLQTRAAARSPRPEQATKRRALGYRAG